MRLADGQYLIANIIGLLLHPEQLWSEVALYAVFTSSARQIKSNDLGENGTGPGRLLTWSGNDTSGELNIETFLLAPDSGLTVDIDVNAIQPLSADLPE